MYSRILQTPHQLTWSTSSISLSFEITTNLTPPPPITQLIRLDSTRFLYCSFHPRVRSPPFFLNQDGTTRNSINHTSSIVVRIQFFLYCILPNEFTPLQLIKTLRISNFGKTVERQEFLQSPFFVTVLLSFYGILFSLGRLRGFQKTNFKSCIYFFSKANKTMTTNAWRWWQQLIAL